MYFLSVIWIVGINRWIWCCRSCQHKKVHISDEVCLTILFSVFGYVTYRVAEKPVDPAKPKDQGQRQTAEDSLSSISMESDDEHILNQVRRFIK